VLAQRGPLVVGPEDPAFLQQRHDRVGELIQAARRDVRDENESVAGIRLNQRVDRLGDCRRGPDERLPPGDFDDQLADGQALLRCLGPPLRRGGQRIAVHPHAGPAAGDGVLARIGIDIGQRPVGVIAGQVPVPQLLEELDRGLPADLLKTHLPGQLSGVGVGVAEDEGRGRQDQQLVWRPAVLGQAALDVGVERLAFGQRAVPAEDRVRARGGELAALLGVAGLEDDRPSLRAARHVELTADVEVHVVVLERARLGLGEELAGRLVGDDLISAPGVEQIPGGLQEGTGSLVPGVLRQEAAAPEVLPGERVPGSDDVPGGPAAGQVVQAGELPRHLIRLVESGVDRARQAEPVSDRGERGQDGKGVRAAHHVEVVNLAVLLPQPQALGEEQEVELGAFSRPGQMREGAELDVAARARVAPDRRVVHAGKVRGEMDLLDWLGHGRLLPELAAV
jgi:hypothetical protein